MTTTLATPLSRIWRTIVLCAAAALIAIVFAWQLLPTATLSGWLTGLVLSVPLFAPLPGLWQGKRYTYRWASLCVLPYFVVGLTEVVANPSSRMWTAAMLAIALAWFVGLVGFLRVTRPPMSNAALETN